MLSEEERKAKENALSGLTGGSFSEIVTLLLVVPVRNSDRLCTAIFASYSPLTALIYLYSVPYCYIDSFMSLY